MHLLSVIKHAHIYACSASRRHDSGISVDLERSGLTIHRRPSKSAAMLRSVLKCRSTLNSSSSESESDTETGSIRQTVSAGPKSISISPEPSTHSSEAEDIFDVMTNSQPNLLSRQQTAGLLDSPKKHPLLKAGTSVTLMEKRSKHLHERRSVSVSCKDPDPEIHGPATLGRNTTGLTPLPTGPSGKKRFVERAQSLDKRKFALRRVRSSTLNLNIQQVCILTEQ